MKIKETICTETDYRGRVIKRTRIVEEVASDTDRGYDYGTRYGERPAPRNVALGGIMAAYEDYLRSQEW